MQVRLIKTWCTFGLFFMPIVSGHEAGWNDQIHIVFPMVLFVYVCVCTHAIC